VKPVFGVTKSEIYFDNAATTMIDPAVVDAMRPFLEENYGNPDTLYHLGKQSRVAVDGAREQIADLLGCKSDRIFFTSGGTEANNWVVKSTGVVRIVASAIEHQSILKPLEWLARSGFGRAIIPVDNKGIIDLNALEEELDANGDKPGGELVCVQYANNEIGTIQPIKRIAELVHSYGGKLFVDAVQMYGKELFYPEDDCIDFMSISSHKIHGPMGIGALYIAPGLSLEPLFHGGGQESGMRSGTLPVHQIVGFGAASDIARCSRRDEMPKIKGLIRELDLNLEVVGKKRNGDTENCLPNILSVQIPDTEGALVAAILNKDYGICVACGAACSRGNPSHVLKAIGLTDIENSSTIRISLSKYNTSSQINYFIASIQGAIKKSKEMI
jgi:cysteine desulfurase